MEMRTACNFFGVSRWQKCAEFKTGWCKIVSVEHLSSGLKMSFLVKKLHLVCSTANIGKLFVVLG